MTKLKLVELVSAVPHGFRIRKWTYRDDERQNYHGVVQLSESPLHLGLSWRQTKTDPVQPIGIFRLDLKGLLRGNYIRTEPKDSYEADSCDVRLRIVREDCRFYIRVNKAG